MSSEIIKTYENDGFTIIWKPKKCMHSAVCVKMLPNVYHPKDKPWITMENATTAELKTQINACPSGALSYEGQEQDSVDMFNASLMENGPLLVDGKINLKNTKGETTTLSGTNAFCRCGASSNKPFCDGSHAKVNFKDD
jgi:uncharacterized Fe-S cluster protein YjdI